MKIGYIRVSKSDGIQVLDLQRDALLETGVEEARIYSDLGFGRTDDRPGLATCLKSLQPGNTLVVWKLDRLGRSLKHLVEVVEDLNRRRVGLQVLTGAGAQIDTTTANGRLVFGIFAALAEFEAELVREYLRRTCSRTRERPLGWETTQDDAGKAHYGNVGACQPGKQADSGRSKPKHRENDAVRIFERRRVSKRSGTAATEQ